MSSEYTLAPSLDGLPPELQQQIISHLADSCSKSVHSLLCTCKHLYDIALPFSVRTYCSAPHPAKHEGPQERNRTLQFLRYITLVRPELARHVQTLNLHRWSFKQDGENKALKLGTDEWPVYKKIIHEALPSNTLRRVMFERRWIEALQKSVEDATAALLLIVCLNIQTIIYYEPEEKYGIFSNALVTIINDSRSGTGSAFLTKLQTVEHKIGECYDLLSGTNFAAWLFNMPHIRTYEGVRITLFRGSISPFRSRYSDIQSLILSESQCVASILNLMADSCKALREFRYTRQTTGTLPNEITPREIIEALLQHAGSLECLYIDSSDRLYPWWKIPRNLEPCRTCMGTQLRQMHKLRDITLVVQCLIGLQNISEELSPDLFRTPAAPPFAECLPEQLERIEIRGCEKDNLPQLTEFLKTLRNKSRFPRLQLLRLTFYHRGADEVGLENVNINRSGLVFEVMQYDIACTPSTPTITGGG